MGVISRKIVLLFGICASLAACSGGGSSAPNIPVVEPAAGTIEQLLNELAASSAGAIDGGSLDALQSALNDAFGNQLSGAAGTEQAAALLAGSNAALIKLLELSEALLDAGRDSGNLLASGDLNQNTAGQLFAGAGDDLFAQALDVALIIERFVARTALGLAPNAAIDQLILAAQQFQALASNPATLSDPQAIAAAFSQLASATTALQVGDLLQNDPTGLLSSGAAGELLSALQDGLNLNAGLLGQLAAGTEGSALLNPASEYLAIISQLSDSIQGIASGSALDLERDNVQLVLDLLALDSQLGEIVSPNGVLAQAALQLEAVLQLLSDPGNISDALLCGLLGQLGACPG